MGLLNKILNKEEKDQKDKSAKDESVVKDAKEAVKPKQKTEQKELTQKEVVKEKTSAPKKVDKISSKEDTKNAYKILVKPLISEKAADIGKLNKYVFAVNIKANKQEIKKAITAVYGIKPIKINIIKMQGKRVNFGRRSGRRNDWKKAVVTLPQGKSIEIYEGT
jgi:large subunit ribosomal protein L23